MQLHVSRDGGASWTSLGNPYVGPYAGMQAIYQMCATEHKTERRLRRQAPDW